MTPISQVTEWYFNTIVTLWNFFISYGWIFAGVIVIPIIKRISKYIKSVIR